MAGRVGVRTGQPEVERHETGFKAETEHLSNNLDLGKDMGTRHRACLGIAENSDAIAIVVSEETGIISMAKNGVLIRHFDRQSLYTRLIDEMIPKESTVEKNTADSWVEQAKKLWNWISQKGEDEQQ